MTKTFFLVGPNVHHIEELQKAKEDLTQIGQLQVFEINSTEEYQAAINGIKSYSQENPTDKIRIVTDAHGVERKGEDGKSHGTGQLGFGSKEVYPAEIAIDLEGCNIEFIDNSACCIGTGIASKGNENLERYQNIPPNVAIILNGGKLRAITSLLQPEIVKTLSLDEDSSALDNFLNKVFHPNTLKVVMKKEDGELVTHKMSAPKPTSRKDVTSKAVTQHIGQEVNRAVDWWRDNVDSSINSEDLKKSCAERITPELVEQYRGQALIMETHRKKADYVRYYIEAGTDPNQTLADGTTPLHMSCSKIEIMKELLKSDKVDVNRLDLDGISVLCGASYAKNSKEATDLIMNHPQFDQTLESFNASREAMKSIYLKGQPEHHDMNNSLVNYVRAELCFREGKFGEAKKYIGVAIEGEVADPSRKQEYQDRFQSYNRSMEALDLAMPKETVGNKSETSWVEKMKDKNLSALKEVVKEI